MHLQTLSSGSRGNATLVRAGETHVLVDAGLPLRELDARLAGARVAPAALDHLVLTHGHLDHARSAGALGRRGRLLLHCCERLMRNASVRRAPRMNTLRVGQPQELSPPAEPARGEPREPGSERLLLTPVQIPHDADPTVAFRLDHETRGTTRTAVILTDMGRPDRRVARALSGAHLVVLEFNHDTALLQAGPYPAALKRRVGGDGGHLSNEQAVQMLRWMAGPELHTLVLAHLSEKNNTAALAVECARAALGELGLDRVQVRVAEQDAIGPNLAV